VTLVFLSYIYIDNQSTTDPIKNAISERVDNRGKNQILGSAKNQEEQSSSSRISHSYSSPPTLDPTPKPRSSLNQLAHSNTKPPSSHPISKANIAPRFDDSDFTNNTVNAQKRKNNLVLHIGPQKTGSTTLQEAWTYPYGILSKPLKKDNYRYEFIHRKSGYFDCDMTPFGGLRNCESSPKLKHLIHATKNAGQNLLLSDENLGNEFSTALRDVVDDNDWDVTVIVVYRRIHQWLISWYDQINKTTNKDSKGNILFDKNGNTYRKEHTIWPDEGGSHIPTFSSWYKKFTRGRDKSQLVSRHRSIEFMDAYKPYFSNIVVHNMHQDGDLMTNFMCDSFPDANHCCNRLKNQSQGLRRDNQSVNLNYDILAVKARESGALMTRLSRKDTVAAIEMYTKETGKKIPLVCDSGVIDEIKNWLLDSEKAMFHETWSDQKTSDLKDVFDSYLENGKLCDIDFDEVFRDKEWMAFFKLLDNRPHLILHVGPQSTGSKTLQHVWDAPDKLRSFLRKDNFDYHYINPHRGMFDCGVEGDTLIGCQASNKLLQILAKASAQGKNLILSDENLGERFSGTLRNAIDDKRFRVKVVVMYRRIHQWLPRWYSLINKTTNMDPKGKFLRDENGAPTRQPHTHWPSEGGVHIPNFSDWYRKFAHGLDSTKLALSHRSIVFKNAYEPYFDHIEVFDVDQEGDLVTNFMCQMIPEASKTCNRLKQGSIDLAIENASEKVELDILSVQAYEYGLIDEKVSRPVVVSEVRKHVQNSGAVLPRRCDNEVIDQIRDWLLESEKLLFPDSWSPNASEALEKKFNSDSSTGELCDIDIEKVLGDEGWVNFFASLGNV